MARAADVARFPCGSQARADVLQGLLTGDVALAAHARKCPCKEADSSLPGRAVAFDYRPVGCEAVLEAPRVAP